ncbi:putative DNA ligase (ATP) [Helianthus annuus]|nr:putative DNA ligase (ATP) [Helianthus annuus]KAJ0637979.1 putative DNA ligase (ATP) [Helianthus annuus]KAJ0815166.1 putative DNA ligase (ATP) [Helianthus annuus]
MNLFFEEVFHSSCEGMMVKSLDVEAAYLPSKCSDSWLKVKRDYVEGLNDSLDLVPIGAWSYGEWGTIFILILLFDIYGFLVLIH